MRNTLTTRHWVGCCVAASTVLLAQLGYAQNAASVVSEAVAGAVAVTPEAGLAQRSTSAWLLRMHEASRRRAYIGTLVVSSGNHMASSRIWHVCDGTQQMERVESLSGAPRSTYRHNHQVITFSPQTKVAVREKREALGLFPHLLTTSETAIDQLYAARYAGVERVAGLDADVVQLEPKDKLRFAYRAWSEKKTGLVVKLQTLDSEDRVLEQVAFSELQLDAPVNMNKLVQMMAQTEGYRVEQPEMVKTTAVAEGWSLKSTVAGFKAMSCYRRPTAGGGAAGNTVQWIFSDGLATVSLFIEAFDRNRHNTEGLMAMGATHTLARRISDKSGSKGGDWWLTAVGEVPAQTLQAFAQNLERKK